MTHYNDNYRAERITTTITLSHGWENEITTTTTSRQENHLKCDSKMGLSTPTRSRSAASPHRSLQFAPNTLQINTQHWSHDTYIFLILRLEPLECIRPEQAIRHHQTDQHHMRENARKHLPWHAQAAGATASLPWHFLQLAEMCSIRWHCFDFWIFPLCSNSLCLNSASQFCIIFLAVAKCAGAYGMQMQITILFLFSLAYTIFTLFRLKWTK